MNVGPDRLFIASYFFKKGYFAGFIPIQIFGHRIPLGFRVDSLRLSGTTQQEESPDLTSQVVYLAAHHRGTPLTSQIGYFGVRHRETIPTSPVGYLAVHNRETTPTSQGSSLVRILCLHS